MIPDVRHFTLPELIMPEHIALIDMGGTFTKLATIYTHNFQIETKHKYPSNLLWARRDLVAKRLFAEFRAISRRGVFRAPTREAGLKFYQKIVVSFAGNFISGRSGLVDLYYVNKWNTEAESPKNTGYNIHCLNEILGVDQNNVVALVDKFASGLAFISRNPDRDGASLTLGTGTGLVRIFDNKIYDDVTSRTILMRSKRSGEELNLHKFIGGKNLLTLAGGSSGDMRRSLSDRLCRTLLAVEDALLRLGNKENLLIEIAGGGSELYDDVAILRNFERERRSCTDLSFVNDSEYNNIHGLAYLCRTNKSVEIFYGT